MAGMSRLSMLNWITITTGCVALSTIGFAIAADPAPAPAFNPAPIKPTLIDFLTGMPVTHSMQVMATPKLLRPGFAGEMDNTAKGLASKIKAKEVDVPKRVKAAKYLGKVDCQAFPESQTQLLDLVVNDEFEEVRLAAAKAFQEQFSKGQDPNPSKRKQRRYDNCRGCCNNVDVINKLSKRTYECDENGCPYEPSLRVREAIAEALQSCCCWQYNGGQNYQPPVPPTPDAAPPTEAPKDKAPAVPAESTGTAATEGLEKTEAIQSVGGIITPSNEQAAGLELQTVGLEETASEETMVTEEKDLPLVECLRGHCPVGMAERRLERASAENWTVHNGFRYEFASQEAKDKFLNDPKRYAPILNGYCVVTFSKTGEKVVGNVCREHNGQQHWFATKELREEFKADPEKFLEGLEEMIEE